MVVAQGGNMVMEAGRTLLWWKGGTWLCGTGYGKRQQHGTVV